MRPLCGGLTSSRDACRILARLTRPLTTQERQLQPRELPRLADRRRTRGRKRQQRKRWQSKKRLHANAMQRAAEDWINGRCRQRARPVGGRSIESDRALVQEW